MASRDRDLIFHIDVGQLEALQQILGATADELAAAYNRAIARTAVTMKSKSLRFLRDEMGAKSLKVLRKRIQTHKYSFRLGKTGEQTIGRTGEVLDDLKLWFGLNDMRIGDLKGRTSRNGTKRKPQGAVFTSKGLGRQEFEDSFLANLYRRRSIFTRKGAERFPVREQRIPIADDLQDTLEDEVLHELEQTFMHHFTIDLKGRVAARGLMTTR